MKIHSFPPVLPEHPRVLILGSMPSRKSLEKEEYYGHPRNHFWIIMTGLFGEAVPEMYEEKKQLLIRHGIALWDVYASCFRPGSLDRDISQPEYNDISGLLSGCREIRAVCCNGTAAAAGFSRLRRQEPSLEQIITERDISVHRLPSTSPIPTKFYRSAEDKISQWKTVVTYCAAGS